MQRGDIVEFQGFRWVYVETLSPVPRWPKMALIRRRMGGKDGYVHTARVEVKWLQKSRPSE